jgi:hypothetical protein
VLDAIARALQLDEAERTHLFHLAQAADGTSAAMRPRRRNHWTVRPGLEWTLDSITTGPAIVGNNRSDLLATNLLGRALYADLYIDPNGAPNFARFTFLDSAAHRFYPDWEFAADTTVANLRTAAGQDPYNKSLHDLVGELSTRSDEFRRRWSSHNVRTHGTGIKHFHHHIVGDLTLAYESLDLRAEPGLTMTIYAANPTHPPPTPLPCSPPGQPPNNSVLSRHRLNPLEQIGYWVRRLGDDRRRGLDAKVLV